MEVRKDINWPAKFYIVFHVGNLFGVGVEVFLEIVECDVFFVRVSFMVSVTFVFLF